MTPIPSPSPSCSKLQLVDNKKKVGLSILKVNSKTVPLNKTNLDNTILDFKNLEYKQNEEINSILLDIQNKKINKRRIINWLFFSRIQKYKSDYI